MSCCRWFDSRKTGNLRNDLLRRNSEQRSCLRFDADTSHSNAVTFASPISTPTSSPTPVSSPRLPSRRQLHHLTRHPVWSVCAATCGRVRGNGKISDDAADRISKSTCSRTLDDRVPRYLITRIGTRAFGFTRFTFVSGNREPRYDFESLT